MQSRAQSDRIHCTIQWTSAAWWNSLVVSTLRLRRSCGFQSLVNIIVVVWRDQVSHSYLRKSNIFHPHYCTSITKEWHAFLRMLDGVAWWAQNDDGVVKIYQGKWKFIWQKDSIYCALKGSWGILWDERLLNEVIHSWWDANAVISRSLTSTCFGQLPLLASKVITTATSPRESIRSSIWGIGYESRFMTAFNFPYITLNRGDLFFWKQKLLVRPILFEQIW